MISFKTIFGRNSIRLLILFLSSVLVTIVINSFHPAKLPLILSEERRPGIPAGSWQEKIRFINVDQMVEEASTGQIVIIDLRERDHFSQLHAAGSINLPYYEFEEVYSDFIDRTPIDKSIFIFCEGMLCGLSTRVAKELLDAGYNNLTVVKQGFEGWVKSQLPMEGFSVKGEGY